MTTQDRPRSPVRSSDTDLLRLLTGAVEKLRSIPDKLGNIETHLSCLCTLVRQFTVWRGQWTATPPSPYLARDQVIADGWLAIANKDNPQGSPIPTIGAEGWVFDLTGGDPVWSGQTIAEGAYLTGQEYAFEDGGLVSAIAVTLPGSSTAFSFEIWVVANPGQVNETVTQVAVIPGVASQQRFELPMSAEFLVPGETLQVFLVARAITQPNSFSATWAVKNENGNPSENEANFQNSATEIRVHKTDKDDNDQTSNLEAVEAGGTLAFGGSTWTITDVDIRGSHVRYHLTPNQGRPSENDYLLSFTWGSADPIPYLEQTGYWGSYPLIDGLEGPDRPSLIRSDTAYAVDVYVAQLEANPDWDLQAYSG